MRRRTSNSSSMAAVPTVCLFVFFLRDRFDCCSRTISYVRYVVRSVGDDGDRSVVVDVAAVARQYDGVDAVKCERYHDDDRRSTAIISRHHRSIYVRRWSRYVNHPSIRLLCWLISVRVGLFLDCSELSPELSRGVECEVRCQYVAFSISTNDSLSKPPSRTCLTCAVPNSLVNFRLLSARAFYLSCWTRNFFDDTLADTERRKIECAPYNALSSQTANELRRPFDATSSMPMSTTMMPMSSMTSNDSMVLQCAANAKDLPRTFYSFVILFSISLDAILLFFAIYIYPG